jgi:hypothetical protein
MSNLSTTRMLARLGFSERLRQEAGPNGPGLRQDQTSPQRQTPGGCEKVEA